MSDSIVELLDEMYDEQSEKTSLGEVVERFEDRGFGPLLLMPALIALLPHRGYTGRTQPCAA